MYTQKQIDEAAAKEPKYMWWGAGCFIGSMMLAGTIQSVALLAAGVVVAFIFAFLDSFKPSEKMRTANTVAKCRRKLAKMEADKAQNDALKARKKEAFERAKDTLWRAVDPAVRPEDKPSKDEVEMASAYINSFDKRKGMFD